MSRTSTSRRSRLPVDMNSSEKLNADTITIQNELDPDS